MNRKMGLFAVAALVLITLASTVSAWYYVYPSYGYGGYTTCCTTYYSYPTYYPAYYNSYYAPVIYPTYYYAPTYYVPAYSGYYYAPRSLFSFNFYD